MKQKKQKLDLFKKEHYWFVYKTVFKDSELKEKMMKSVVHEDILVVYFSV